MKGTDLLANFRESHAEDAFAELVRRYTNLVFSVAKRRLSNISLAEDVTQVVFIRLAKAAPKLSGEAALVAWLHRTTVHVSIDLWRSEMRRQAREEHAAAMQTNCLETTAWNQLAPVLDEALNELTDAERQAILLRFFNQKTMRDLGVVFGISEDAAKMRVSRALDRLRTQLGARGITCTSIALVTMLADCFVEAAPSQLAATLAALTLPLPAGLSTASGILSFVGQLSRVKLVAALAATLVVGTAFFILLRPPDPANRGPGGGRSQDVAPQNEQARASAAQESAISEPEREPDPLKLLQAVAKTRQRIASGSMDLQLSVDNFLHLGFSHAGKETNQLRLKTAFDGQKSRIESFGREYNYVGIGAEGEAAAARIEEQHLDRSRAVQAGLLKPFESHHVTVWDGTSQMDYWETDGKGGSTTIDDWGKSSVFLFDPRCLGLRTSLFASSTIDNCLSYTEAKSISLAGKELVEGVPAWHVRVTSKHDESLDFWIDVSHPTHVVRHAKGGDVAVSKYDDSTPGDAIPIEVTTREFRNGSPFLFNQFVRSNARFNVPIESASWTLAGLGMAVGTPVTDIRIHRRIGYWTGEGLSEFPPPAKIAESQLSPNLADLFALLDNNPASPEALGAAAWIVLNTPDGPEVEKAAEVILREHIENPNLEYLCQKMGIARHHCARRLLEAMLAKNPNLEVRAAACFTLATLLKDDANFGLNKKATAEAEKLFDRATSEFSRAGSKGTEFARRAKPELYELRHLTIGKPAPETEGTDLEGQKMKLSDYRGQVVVLYFWSGDDSEAQQYPKLIRRMAEKPFAFIGVNGDDDLAKTKAAVEKYQVTWPCFSDGRGGPIHTAWNVKGWPTIFVLDTKGVIRFRNPRGGELDKALDGLLRE